MKKLLPLALIFALQPIQAMASNNFTISDAKNYTFPSCKIKKLGDIVSSNMGENSTWDLTQNNDGTYSLKIIGTSGIAMAWNVDQNHKMKIKVMMNGMQILGQEATLVQFTKMCNRDLYNQMKPYIN